MTIFKTIFYVIVGLWISVSLANENVLSSSIEEVPSRLSPFRSINEQNIEDEIEVELLLLKDAVINIYLKHNFQPLWVEPLAEKVFLKEYAAFAASGISVKSTNAIKKILATPPSFKRDILLTDSFLDYLYYTQNVNKFANQWLYQLGSYRVKVPNEQVIIEWINAVQTKTASQFILNLIPRNHIYQQTIDKLFQMNSDTLLSTEKGEKSSIKTNKKSTAGTVSLQKLALNAQRLRLIPSFHNGIFVNIPSYQLYYFRDGQLILQSKVIVGRNERRTPVMYSKLSNVIVNPPWNVPATIKNEDLVPKMRQDPSYVERHSYEIIDKQGNRLDPHSIDWEQYQHPDNNFPYRLRQKAGNDSALGRYKFNMPSVDAIFLHDTPNRDLFGKKNRALSSGCVRVAKSDELATLLLKEAGWTEQRKQKVLESKKTTSAQIRSDNPVYLYYVTAWIDQGILHTLPDIYQFDTELPKVILDWEYIKAQIDI